MAPAMPGAERTLAALSAAVLAAAGVTAAVLAAPAARAHAAPAARAAGGAPADAAEPIRIGLYGSFDVLNNGPAMRDGARLAAEAINEAGGVLGRRIAIVERDDGGDPAEGVRIVLELADRERVAALVGPSLTIVADATSPVVNERRIPEVIAGATGNAVNELIDAGDDSYVFRFSPSDRIQATMLAREAVEVRRRRRPAILHEDTAFGEQGRDRLVEALRRRGVEPVLVAAIAPDGRDVLSKLAVARAAGADALLTYALAGPSARIVRGLQRLGWRPDLLGSWALSQDGFLRAAGPWAEGAVMPQTFIVAGASGGDAARFLARWRSRLGPRLVSASAAAQGWDALHLLALAFEQAGSTDPRGVKAALESLRRPYDGVTGRHWKPWSAIDHEGIKRGDVRMGVVRAGQVVPLPPR